MDELLGLQLLCTAVARARNGNRVTVMQQLLWRGAQHGVTLQRACRDHCHGLGEVSPGWGRHGNKTEGRSMGKEKRNSLMRAGGEQESLGKERGVGTLASSCRVYPQAGRSPGARGMGHASGAL